MRDSTLGRLTYQACSNGVLTTEPWTRSGNPVDDPVATRYYCVGASARTATICGSTDRRERPDSCSTGFSLNSVDCCEQDRTYQACSNGVVTTQPWTGSGNPVDDDTATRYYCVGASARTATICGSTDDDDKPDSCRTGYSLNSVDCCEQDQTYQACSNGVLTTKPWTGSGNPVDDDTATRYYCVGASARTEPICGSTDQLEHPNSCATGYSLNSVDCCEQDQTYEACSNGVLTTKPWTGSGNPVDDDTATRYYCVGASARTEPICGSTDDDDKPDSCRTGYSLNSVDCCEQDQTYQACSNGVLTTEPWTRSGSPVDDPVATRYFCIGATPDDEPICASGDRNDKPRSCGTGFSFNKDDCCEQDVIPPPRGIERYCDSNGVAQERPAPGADNVDNLDEASDCTSRQILNSDSCCVAITYGTERYCDSNGVAQEREAPGTDDVNKLDKASDCTSRQTLNSDSCCVDLPPRGRESYCDSNGVAREREAPGTDNVNNLDSASDCRNGESLNNQSCCVVCPPTRKNYCSTGQDWEWNTTTCSWDEVDVDPDACYNRSGYTYVYDTWLSTACDYTTTSSVDPQPSNDCGTGSWSTASCGWGDPPALPSRSGCPGTGLAWGNTINNNTCTYNTVAVTQPSCSKTLVWELCAWECPAIKITFSFPSLISEQTSQASTEQNLDLAFNSDGSITLVETLVGPNSTTRTSLDNWATGADMARVSEVVEYRLAGNNGGQCTGSSSWAAFSGLTVGVFGEAAVGQATASCSYAFRYEDSHESIGSTRIQLSTQASSDPGMPGQMN